MNLVHVALLTLCLSRSPLACQKLGRLATAEGRRSETLIELVAACGKTAGPACLLASDWERSAGRLTESRRLSRSACERGFQPSCVQLGETHLNGGDDAIADSLFEKACRKGDPSGCYRLAIQHEWAGADDVYPLLWKACGKRFRPACDRLDTDLARRELPPHQRRKNDVRRLESEQCRGGDLEACNAAAVDSRDKGRRRRLFGLACDGGLALGCRNLAEAEADLGQAAGARAAHARWQRILESACAQNDSGACFEILVWQENGEGKSALPDLRDRTARLMAVRCKGGDGLACNLMRLPTLYEVVAADSELERRLDRMRSAMARGLAQLEARRQWFETPSSGRCSRQ